MKKLIIITIILLLQSCIINKKTHITVYGKTWYNGKSVGVIYSVDTAYRAERIEIWPDSLVDQYVNVTGWLKTNKDKYENDTNTNKQIYFVKYSIIHPKISTLYNDSIKDMIDSASGKYIEIRRFVNCLQSAKILDTIVSSDSIIFLYNHDIHYKLPAYRFINIGSKTIYFKDSDIIYNYKIPEYFEFSEYPEKKGSEYNIELTHVKVIGGIKVEKKYHLTGNSDKIIIIPIL